jgi:autophagy-related protein 5
MYAADSCSSRHWPIGLLYDYHTANASPSSYRSSNSGTNDLASAMRQLSTNATDTVIAGAPQDQNAPQSVPRPPLPWRLTLRIGNAPLEKIHSAPGLGNCRTSFMSMLKEADFVRWGSTKRVTNLRKTEQDALWEGVVSHNFELYWSVASKIIPSMPTSDPNLTAGRAHNGDGISGRSSLTQQTNESQASLHSTAPSEAGTGAAESSTGARAGNTQYRSIPMRFHLLQGAPVVQEPIAPYTEDGRPVTLHSVLSALFPLLVPPVPTFSTSNSQVIPPPMAYAVIQGIRIPFEAEIPWIGSALSSADGW